MLCSAGTTPRTNMMIPEAQVWIWMSRELLCWHLWCDERIQPCQTFKFILQLDDLWMLNNVKDVVVNFCLLNLQCGSVPAGDASLLWGSVTGLRFKTHVSRANLVHWKSEKLILVNRTNFLWFPAWLSIDTLTESWLSFFMDFCKPGFVDLWPLGQKRDNKQHLVSS